MEAITWVVLLIVIPVVAVVFALTVGLWMDGPPRVDYDYWWHLATGNWILDHHRVPREDPFSWTHGGENWVAHEWLAAVMFAAADRAQGYSGAITLAAVVTIAGLWRLIAAMRFYGLSRRAIFLLLLLLGGAFLRSGVLVLRPQVLTFALLAILLAEIAAYETGRRRRLWVLPPLFLLWTNLNLTVLFGGLFLAAFVIDRMIKGRLDRHLMTVCGLSALALLINPRGPFLLTTVLKYRDPDSLRYQYIFEWMQPTLTDVTHLPFLIGLLAIPFAIRQLFRMRIWPALPVLVLAYQSFTAVRFIPIYTMLVLLFAAWLAWQTALDAREEVAPAPPLIARQGWGFALAVVTAVVAGSIAARSEASQFRDVPIAWGYPAQAATILLEHYPNQRLFNVYDYGGYLIHRFDGEMDVYIDGREEMYGEAHLETYFDLIYGEPGWEETLEQEDVDVVLIRHIDGLTDEIQDSPEWQQVFRNNASALYVRSDLGEV